VRLQRLCPAVEMKRFAIGERPVEVQKDGLNGGLIHGLLYAERSAPWSHAPGSSSRS
jgi:hypothetical protein